jgi:hypothetical protein
MEMTMENCRHIKNNIKIEKRKRVVMGVATSICRENQRSQSYLMTINGAMTPTASQSQQ